jgi:hypothetical protein
LGKRRLEESGHHGADKTSRKAAATAGSVMNADEKIRESAHGFLSGGGELGQLIRQFDWAATSIGAPETWPQNLRTALRIMLTSRQPIWIGWGRELIYFYNDPYKSIIGGKHPWALGQPFSEVWREI